MTIAEDIDAAMEREGGGVHAMRLRMGPAAQRALIACANDRHFELKGEELAAYKGVRIVGVPAPEFHSNPGTADCFHGWELRA